MIFNNCPNFYFCCHIHYLLRKKLKEFLQEDRTCQNLSK